MENLGKKEKKCFVFGTPSNVMDKHGEQWFLVVFLTYILKMKNVFLMCEEKKHKDVVETKAVFCCVKD